MRKSLRLFFAAMVIIGGLSVVSFAQEGDKHRPRNINERQDRQKNRIKDGIQDGELTRREAGRLIHEQREVNQLERRLRNTGEEFTRIERARVQRQLNQSNRHIRRAKHN